MIPFIKSFAGKKSLGQTADNVLIAVLSLGWFDELELPYAG